MALEEETMCCFSGPVEHVAGTRIFARRAENGRQVLAYQMQYAARRPVAMILPLPVAYHEEGGVPLVRFVSLKKYPHFFADLEAAFPVPRAVPASKSAMPAAGAAGGVLRVEAIGDFVASFVPTIADFSRLDKRFVLPPQTWDKIPAYRDYGFAVFQLKAAPQGQSVHPMALSFASRFSDQLFFPTVHIHDGLVHSTEEFDHDLYWQPKPARNVLGRFGGHVSTPDNAQYVRRSDGAVSRYMDVAGAKNLIGRSGDGVKARLVGTLENRDTFVVDG